MKQENSVKITGIIAVAVIVVCLIGYFTLSNIAGTNNKIIESQGFASIMATPDLITVYFNIETKGQNATSAKDENNKINEQLVDSLIKLGIAKEKIQTQGINIYEDQVWENNKYVSKGYKASHQIKIVLDSEQIGLISEVIDSGVNSGAMLSYINFELSTPRQNEYKAQALKQAGEDARMKADAIAEGLGMKVGSLVSVSTSEFYYQPWNLYSSRDSSSGSANAAEAKLAINNIVPGDQQVTANIITVYKLK